MKAGNGTPPKLAADVFVPVLKVQDGRLVDFNGSALSAGRAGVVDVSLVVGRAQ